jgi:hypothetical protein
MRKIYFVTLLLALAIVGNAQNEKTEKKKEPVVKFSGHIRYEAYFDTYESVYTRDGNIYLFPKRVNFDAQNNDINQHNQLNMLAAQSRVRAKINGPDAFGAKISGMIEVDFLGKMGGPVVDFVQTPRIRHMFVKMNWDKLQMIFGQTWHPVFVTECFPSVLGMGAAIPFNPLNRSPQIKATYKLNDNLKVEGALLSYVDFMGAGPRTAQQNAVMPDFHGSFKYINDNLAAGIVGGYRLLKPRLTTVNNIITDKTVGSYDVAGFVKVKVSGFTIKAYGIYGQNLSPYVVFGGYGADANPTVVDDYGYSNINSMSVWGEVSYKLNSMNFGLFAGYAANLDASGDYYELTSYSFGGNIDNALRISPRASYTSGKLTFGLEYMMTSATYFDLAGNGKYEAAATDDAVSNNRFYFSATYKF